MTANQVVAYNVAKARAIRGWTQEEAAEALAPYLGTRWSVASFSAIERSVDGGRIRRFSADQLLALSRGFDLPIAFFLVPPPPTEEIRLRTAASDDEHPQVLLDAVLGTPGNLEEWERVLLECCAAMARTAASGRSLARGYRAVLTEMSSRDCRDLAELCRRVVYVLEDLETSVTLTRPEPGVDWARSRPT
jgi:transcriptional regulator with XRE-family HTH domain